LESDVSLAFVFITLPAAKSVLSFVRLFRRVIVKGVAVQAKGTVVNIVHIRAGRFSDGVLRSRRATLPAIDTASLAQCHIEYITTVEIKKSACGHVLS
jgi:hypothetical protein